MPEPEPEPDNPVVALCVSGMLAEAREGPKAALRLFDQAWAVRKDSFDACVAAHYLARHQPTAEETLAWNRRALDYALEAEAERVADFLPSLHLNLAKSYEDAGDSERAQSHYRLARQSAAALGENGYRELVERGIDSGLARMAAQHDP